MNWPLIIFPGIILAWALHRGWRTSPRIVEPAWRSHAAIMAAVLVGWSDLMMIIYGILTEMSGNGSCNHSLCTSVATIGFFAGPIGLFASLPGNEKRRWPVCGLSALMTVFWLAAGLGA